MNNGNVEFVGTFLELMDSKELYEGLGLFELTPAVDPDAAEEPSSAVS